MINRELGRSGITVNAIGLGCMGLSEFYGPATEKSEAISLLHEAIEHGVNHFDTAEMYGMGANEALLGEAFAGKRDQVIIATKFGPLRDKASGQVVGIDGSEANARRAVEESLQLLQTDHIDLYYMHRMDPTRPIEETVGAMAKLVDEGKIRAIGLSEASAETLRRANAVHPIAALQSEYSIFSRDIEAEQFPVLKEFGTSLVAYSPLGRGMLTGRFTADTKPADFRSAAYQPRFADGAFEANLALVEEIKSIADNAGATPAQIALRWVLDRGENILSIPGTTKLSNLKGNLGAADVTLTASQAASLDALADKVVGDRYNEQGMAALNG